MSYKLSDRALVRIFDLVQFGIITGTDIVDNLRTLNLVIENDQLTISDEEDENFKLNVQKLVNLVESKKLNQE